MNAKLILAAGAVALLIIPTVSKAMAESGGSVSTRNLQAAITLPVWPSASTIPTAAPSQMSASETLPSRGMTMAQVEQSYGAPMARKAPVGAPPITRWEYEGFVVYFEYRHVIHSVANINR